MFYFHPGLISAAVDARDQIFHRREQRAYGGRRRRRFAKLAPRQIVTLLKCERWAQSGIGAITPITCKPIILRGNIEEREEEEEEEESGGLLAKSASLLVFHLCAAGAESRFFSPHCYSCLRNPSSLAPADKNAAQYIIDDYLMRKRTRTYFAWPNILQKNLLSGTSFLRRERFFQSLRDKILSHLNERGFFDSFKSYFTQQPFSQRVFIFLGKKSNLSFAFCVKDFIWIKCLVRMKVFSESLGSRKAESRLYNSAFLPIN